jgi:phosphoglycolate phosphatase-like HAD superfamily hydrolase
MEKMHLKSNSCTGKKSLQASEVLLCILIVLVCWVAIAVIGNELRSRFVRRQIWPMINQSLELALQIDTQQAAVNNEIIRITQELKKPKEEQAADLNKRIQLNAERTEAIQTLIKQQRELLDTLQKRQEEYGIVPKKESSEAKAVLEKY